MLTIVLLFAVLSLGAVSSAKEYIVKIKEKIPEGAVFNIKKKLSDNIYLVESNESILITLGTNNNLIVEKNWKLYKLGNVPNDPCISEKWELTTIGAYDAWLISTGSPDVYVAVLDTGVDYNHPDLKDNLWKNPDEICYDGKDNDNNGYVDDCYGVNVLCYPEGSYDPQATGCNAPDALDDDGHGTHIAGIIGAVGNNGFLIAGINWKVKIIPCKFLDSMGNGDIAGEIACLEYIKKLKQDKGLNIVAVNASYGNRYPLHQIQKDEIASLSNEGILYVTAAGNEGSNIESSNFYPCNYDLENQICVGASDKQDRLASFSNYGATKVKILAPGEKILSLRLGNTSGECSSLVAFDGTSMATPFVTGAVALLRSANGNLSLAEIKRRILLSGDNSSNFFGKSYSCNRLNLGSLLSTETDTIPKICFSSPHLDFGSVNIGSSSKESLILRNTGFADLNIVNLSIDNSAFSIENETCKGKSLSSFQECRIDIKFSPNSESLTQGKLKVVYNSNYMKEITLTGRGISSPKAAENSNGSLNSGAGGCNAGNSNYLLIVLLFLIKLKIKQFLSKSPTIGI